MKYKLIACDMDGTLLNLSSEISPRCSAAIAAAKEKGVTVALSTGRSPASLYQYRASLPESTPIIALNGTLICHFDSDEILFEELLDPKAGIEVQELARSIGASYIVWRRNELYLSDINNFTNTYHRYSNVPIALIDDPEELAYKGVSKILLMADPKVIAQYEPFFKKNLKSPVSCCTSSPHMLEIFSPNASKGTALVWLAEYMGISLSETIAIGDGYNDLSMLETAGLGVAMGNAAQDIKDRCALVAPPNSEDGAAQIIERVLNNKLI